MKIGWIGLGNMGIPMATNLVNAGYAVTVYNRTAEKAQSLTALGAMCTDNPGQLLSECDVIITMVSDDEAVKAVYTGEHGLLEGFHPGKIAIDMSTVSPATSLLLAERCRDHGIEFLDAPVSGSVKPATDGTLIIMAGGLAEAFEKVKPLFDCMGKMALHLGNHGTGSNAKLAINLLLGITIQGISESLLFARGNGIELNDMLTIINESVCGSPISHLKSPAILAGEFPAVFALKHMAKDLRLVKEAGAASPLAKSANESFQEALLQGFGDLDVMAIMKYLSE